ncbi:MAG: helix-turn-helix transcriptional regulator [Daejeonella sp.]|nr:helix-turn-helix transcriptional regulator [Daejeonella sp.]
MIYTAGISIAFFLAFILLTKKNKTEADKILVFWLFITGLDLLFNYLFISDKYYEFPYFLGVEAPMPLFQGPLLFLYTAALTKTSLPKNTKWLHFIIPVGWYLFAAPFLSQPIAYKIHVCQLLGAGHETFTHSTHIAIILSGFIYVGFTISLLKKYQRRIKDHFSDTEKINLKWLLYLVFGMACISMAILFTNDQIIYLLIALNVCVIGYFGVKHVGIFTNTLNSELEIPEADNPQLIKKYEKSVLTNEAALKIHEELGRIMATEKLYKNPELTLSELASALNVNANNLSQVINSYENIPFYDYINNLRIAEFKRIAHLPENKKFTLLTIALEAGFNSKSTFNRNFKKATNLTPKEYLRQTNLVLRVA